MMTLGVLQRQFTLMLGKLIIKAYELGYELTLGEGYDDDGVGHMKGSMHYIRLAQDLNLFKDGVWLDKGPAAEKGFNILHDIWDELGGAERIAKDLNHFSVKWAGRR